MTAMSIDIRGVDDLIDRWERLADDVRNRVSRSVLQAGVDYLVAATRDAVPAAITPGHDNAAIRRSIRGRLSQASGEWLAKVGFNVGPGRRAPHAHLYVLGTKQRFTGARTRQVRGRLSAKKTGNPVANRGVMPSHDFFEAAASSAEGGAIDAMRNQFFREMENVS